MVSIYTDASISTKTAAIAHLVLSDDIFVGYNYKVIPGIYKSYIGELVGIREGLRYYMSLHREPEDVTVYSDSDKALELLSLDTSTLLGLVYKLCTEIHELCDECGATVEHYVGHQFRQNPNQIVDNVSRSVLRGVLRRKENYENIKA